MKFVALKDVRRDIQLTVGEKALEVIDQQGQVIERLNEAQKLQQQQIAFLTRELKDLKAFRESVGATFRGMR